MTDTKTPDADPKKPAKPAADAGNAADKPAGNSKEVGGREGPDPTRFGDWEKNGRCIDF